MIAPIFSTFSVLESNLDKPIVEDLALLPGENHEEPKNRLSALSQELTEKPESSDNIALFQNGNSESKRGTSQADRINAGSGDDVISGLGGNDTIRSGGGNDTVFGGGGADNIRGEGDDDFLNGDGGTDTIRGGGGNDTIDGGDDNDLILGNGGDDTLRGGEGNDTLRGGGGNDDLFGGIGHDILRGNGGLDTFWLGARNATDSEVMTDTDCSAEEEINVHDSDPLSRPRIAADVEVDFVLDELTGEVYSNRDFTGNNELQLIATVPIGITAEKLQINLVDTSELPRRQRLDLSTVDSHTLGRLPSQKATVVDLNSIEPQFRPTDFANPTGANNLPLSSSSSLN